MSSPSNRSSDPSSLLLKQLLLGLSLVLLFVVVDACADSFLFEEETFFGALLSPSPREVVDRLLMLFLVSCFLACWRRVHGARQSLQQALQEALLKAEHERGKLVAVVEAMADGISIQDPQLRILYQNRANQEVMGGHVGELCHQAYHGQSVPCPGCHLVQAFDDGGVHRVEVRRNTDEGTRCFEIIASAVKDDSGAITAGIEVVREITERKLAEQTAKKQAALLQHLIDTIPNPIYYQDSSGRFIWCNSAFAEWLGSPRELIIARTISEVATPELSQVFAETEPTAEQATVREVSLSQGDAMREVIFYKSAFTDGSGEPGGVVGVVIDITERKKAEEEIRALNAALTRQTSELQQVNRELEAFSHAISHDLRTPLTRIYSFSQLLHGSCEKLDADSLFYLKSVNEGCLQMEALLNALMDLSKVTEVKVTMTLVDLSQLVNEKARELQLADPDRQVVFRIAPELRAKGDRQLLGLALENLMLNAWKYTSRVTEPIIEVGSFISADGESVFFVRDNGAGYDSSRSEELFKPFRRLHSSQEFPGTGLGLATVRRIVRRHNGRVWGESRPGQGATFYFTLNG